MGFWKTFLILIEFVYPVSPFKLLWCKYRVFSEKSSDDFNFLRFVFQKNQVLKKMPGTFSLEPDWIHAHVFYLIGVWGEAPTSKK